MKNSQAGQVAVEYILLLALTFGAASGLAKIIKENEFIAGLISTPWRSISMMAENGVWEADPGKARSRHPAHIRRRLSLFGDNE